MNLVCRLLLEKNFFNDTATTEIYTLSLHDALPISFNSMPQYGIYLADFGAPIFMLSMAFAAVISYNKTVSAEGRGKANGKFMRRYLALIGVGCAYVLIYKFIEIFTGGDGIYRGNLNVLIIYGFAGLISMIFFRLKKYWRLGASVV